MMRALGEVAQRAQTEHAPTHRGHTPLGAAHATAYVHDRDLTATATNRRALRARDGHTPVQRRLRFCKERLSASPLSHNRASYAEARRRPRCTCTEAGSDPRGHLWVTWGVYLCAGKPPLADIILSHPPGLTRCDSVIGLAIPAMSGHIQYRGTAS